MLPPACLHCVDKKLTGISGQEEQPEGERAWREISTSAFGFDTPPYLKIHHVLRYIER